MRNTLYKTDKRTYVPGTPAAPESPGQPYKPARTVFEDRTTCGYAPDSITRIDGSAQSGGTGSSISGRASYSYVCTTRRVAVTYPEQPYIPPRKSIRRTPSQTLIDYQVGWTGRARSIASVYGSARCKFRVPKQAQGVVVGLNTEYHEIGYQDIQWAWYVASGIARVIEQGTVRLVFGPVTILNELRVDVVGSAAQYYVDDVLVYQTTNGSVGLLHLDAALYVAGDYVDSPVLEGLDVSDGSGRMLPVFGFGAENNAARGYGVLPAVIGAGGIALAADGVSPIRSAGVGRLLPAIGVGSDYAYSFGEGILLPVTGYASADELAPEFSIGDGALFPVIGYGSGYTVEGGRGEALLPAVLGLASQDPYAAGTGVIRPVVAFGKEGFRDEAQAAFAGVTKQRATLFGETLVVFSANGAVASLLRFGGGALNVSLSESLIAHLTPTLAGVLGTALLQRAVVTDGIPLFDAFATWALNVENGGSTRYENYDFNSFASLNGAYYGCKADGVYLLEGDTDSGNAIQAMLSFGKQDFGTSAFKHISNAYIGVSSTGKLVLRVIAEGESYDYVARASDERLRTQRFDTGRGLRVNQLEFELYNQDGDNFELASVEFAVLPVKRRI